MNEVMQWYERDITLAQAMDGIETNMWASVRNYIAVGFYLKAIRDRKLFQEAGYQNFEEFVRDKYDRDKGWASRCIKVNDQLSKDGNSPVLAEEYREYKVSQLVELAYLTEEQRTLANPDMTVKQLQAIRKPEPQQVKEVVTLQPEPRQESWTESPESEQAHPEKSGKCIHRPEFKCTLEESHKLIPGTGEDCGHKCCWECAKHGNCEWECNSSLHRPEEPEKAKDYGTLETIGGVPVYSLKSKETVDGAYGRERSQIIKEYLKKLHKEESFTIANQIISIEFQAMGSTYKANYDGFCYVRFKEGNQTIMFVELDRLKAEYTVMYPPKKPKPVEAYDGSILRSMIKFEEEELDRMGPERIEKNPYNYTKHMMALEAYKMLYAAHEGGDVGIEQSGD